MAGTRKQASGLTVSDKAILAKLESGCFQGVGGLSQPASRELWKFWPGSEGPAPTDLIPQIIRRETLLRKV